MASVDAATAVPINEEQSVLEPWIGAGLSVISDKSWGGLMNSDAGPAEQAPPPQPHCLALVVTTAARRRWQHDIAIQASPGGASTPRGSQSSHHGPERFATAEDGAIRKQAMQPHHGRNKNGTTSSASDSCTNNYLLSPLMDFKKRGFLGS